MKNSTLSTREISIAVDRTLRRKGWSVVDCCQAYNSASRIGKPINKDFVHRIRKNDFMVVSKRVLDLCNFLEVEAKVKHYSYKLQEEIDAVELLVQKNPIIEPEIRKLLRNIVQIAGE